MKSLLTPKVKYVATVFIFSLPLLSGLIGKIGKSKAWFGDYQAIACAGQKIIEGQPIYDLQLACEGMRPAVFVYLPVIADIAAALARILGQPGLQTAYAIVYVFSLLALIWLIYLRKETPAQLIQKIPFAAFLTGSAVVWGNIAVLCHAAVGFSALLVTTSFWWGPWLFVAIVALCGIVKPVFLTYLAVVLFIDAPIVKRLGLFITGAILGLLPTVLFATDGSALSAIWRETLSHFVYQVTPGESYYGWLALFGLSGNGTLAGLGFILFAGLMTLAGFAIAEALKLSAINRAWLGLSLGVLMIPRLMSQDVFLIGVGLVVIALNSRSLSPSHKLAIWIKDKGLTILTSICAFVLIGNAVELGDYTTRIATLALSLYVLTAGYLSFKSDPQAVMAPIKRLMPARKSA
ncbi:hypothetical protein [Asticcacaulis machinosus]|uniref:DUF2029 domain-containing protein n=1 Tax=Asticcacaulis machinosus TaxID=2984211 RepID=A0ABT5HFH0_9CAUL|nr:hypothetical protein [Asticcacaulis machinosus]MDC7674990.1 hypothetical protein [Asticcacaulis machinosus]